MKKVRLLIVGLTAVCAVAACGAASDDAAIEDKETVFDPLVDNLEKAKDVEQQILDNKKKLDQAIKDAEDAVDD